MSILCYKLCRNETRGFVNGLGSETLAKKKNNLHVLHTLTLGLKSQDSEYFFEKPCSATLVC